MAILCGSFEFKSDATVVFRELIRVPSDETSRIGRVLLDDG